MNVLILTPDAVGSTLLQRLLTIYMQFHDYDRPVINLHELTNGLIRYYSADFNREILGKGQPQDWGYHQSLREITELLKSADHYKTSRLAHYHIRNRQDSIEDQVPFYRYLDENFFVISCRRRNIFEHALSWCLTKITKKLNVYSAQEKINVFLDLYKNKINIDLDVLDKTLDAYKNYLTWCDDHFNVGSYFIYEKHLPDMESYILDLPIFAAQDHPRKWNDVYGISFDDWNRYHFYRSDIGSLALDRPDLLDQFTNNTQETLLEHYAKISDPSWPKIETSEQYQNLPDHIKNECETQHGLDPRVCDLVTNQQFMSSHRANYLAAQESIEQMRKLGIITSGVPIKKQTLREKKHIIKNFDHCLERYNQWANQNPNIATTLDQGVLESSIDREHQQWYLARQQQITATDL